MPSTEKVFQSNLLDSIGEFINQKRIENNEGDNVQFLNVLDFIERFKLFPFGLFPVQSFIIKLYYNIPLDDTIKTITITDKFNMKTLYTFTEVEYLKYLWDTGRCNIKEQDFKIRNELILCLGRRSSKSALSAVFATYELYKLLARGNPQEYYGIPPGSEIYTFCVANDKDQAAIIFNDMQGHIEKTDYFKKAIGNMTKTYMTFRTDSDRKNFGKSGKSTLRINFKSSVAKGLRGRGTILLIMDELAFFTNEGGTGAEEVYKAILPSTAAFSPKDPNNRRIPIGPSDGKIMAISSPNARAGFFYELYQISLNNTPASNNMLMIQAPTWEVNPTISSNYYETEYHKDPNKFMTEHGAQFSDRVRGWIENSHDLTDCIDFEQRPQIRGVIRKPYFFGFDLGLINDGSAVAISHINDGKIELVYHEIWYAGKTWKEANPHLEIPVVPYANLLQDEKRLDLSEIANWLLILTKLFFAQKGVFDQWTGVVLEQELHKRGLTQFESRNFFKTGSSQMYQTFKMFLYNKQLKLYDYPLPKSDVEIEVEMLKHSPLITELLELQATSTDSKMMVVEAPKITGKHDDMSDALARSILLASEFIQERPEVLTSGSSFIVNQEQKDMVRSYRNYHRMRDRMHGSSSQRKVPRQMRSR